MDLPKPYNTHTVTLPSPLLSAGPKDSRMRTECSRRCVGGSGRDSSVFLVTKNGDEGLLPRKECFVGGTNTHSRTVAPLRAYSCKARILIAFALGS